MGKIINFNEYLESKSLDNLEEIIDNQDFSNPYIVKTLYKDFMINYIKANKELIEIIKTTQSSLRTIANFKNQTLKTHDEYSELIKKLNNLTRKHSKKIKDLEIKINEANK